MVVGFWEGGNHFGIRKREDDMSAEIRIHAIGGQFRVAFPILRDEHVITHNFFCRGHLTARGHDGRKDDDDEGE